MIRTPCHRNCGLQRAVAAGLCALLAGLPAKGSAGDEPVPVADFAHPTTAATERDEKIALKVEFSHPFSGRLTYIVDGTAEPGADFRYAEAGIEVERPVREVDIVIDLRDDELVEDAETIRVTLRPGEGFRLGSVQEHTVSIKDNDANWRVVQDVDGMRFDYGMRIVGNGGRTAATVTSDGGNGLPAGTYPVELIAEDNSFKATIGPIPIAADQTLLGAKLARTFTLHADLSVMGHEIDYERQLIGSVVETWTADKSASHLTRGKPISGTFLMSRTIATAPSENTDEQREEKVPTGSRTTASLTGQGSGCGTMDMSGTRNFSVAPVAPRKSWLFPLPRESGPWRVRIGRAQEMKRWPVWPECPSGEMMECLLEETRERLEEWNRQNRKRNEGPIPRGSEFGPVKPTPQYQVSIGQPFSPYVPYSNFVADTLSRALAALYYDKASTQEEKNAAAFRYKTLLYDKEKVDAKTYILAQFGKIGDFWGCAERERAHQAAQNVIGALRYAPWNRELRWALLDIYYDIAVAEKALAQERHVAVAELAIKVPAPGESILDEEIAILEEVLPLYRNALSGFMKVIQGKFGVDVSDFEDDPERLGEPFGYLVFRQEVPLRSPLAALFENDDGDWILPEDARFGDKRPELFDGYKDVTLLFELLREYLRTAEQLSKGYVMRGEPSDFERAENLIGDALLATWLEGNALLAMFPEIHQEGGPIDPKSRLREAIAGWRQSYNALGHIRSMLTGDTNTLGFADDFLVLPQSVIPGDPNQQHFHSYDFFRKYLPDKNGPLGRAKADLAKARQDYENYKDRNDQLAQQFRDRAEHYDGRLREIVGVRPDEAGYEDPNGNQGGAISQQLLNIEQVRRRIDINRRQIENLQEEIRIEVSRRGQEKGINNAISTVYVEYGDEQADLTAQIAEISGDQAFWNHLSGVASSVGAALSSAALAIGGVAAAPVTGGASLLLTGAAVAHGAAALAHGGNAFYQESKEDAKSRLQALKERRAALERSKVNSLHDELLDVNSKARIKKLLLQTSVLALESASTAIGLQQEMERLSGLYLEKEDLERRKAEANERLAKRYFADPSHRLLSQASMLRSLSSFTYAQRWMFLAIRAAEYKWNQAFVHTTDSGVTFTKETLFRTRNAEELGYLFDALNDWDGKMSVGARNDDGYKKFSIKTDFLGYRSGGIYFDPCAPKGDESVSDSEGFQRFLACEDHYLNAEDPENPIPGFKVLKLRFSTAFTPDSGGLFMTNRWLEKVKFLRVRLIGGMVGDIIDSTVEGYLSHGGISLIRNQVRGTPDIGNPDRSMGEATTYLTRHWFYRNGQWLSRETSGSPIYAQVSRDPDVPLSVYQIDTFKEYSVATSEWILYIAVEKKDGAPLVDVNSLQDVEFHLYYYWYARN